jgi:hypothetical protein
MVQIEIIPPPLRQMKWQHEYPPVGRCIYHVDGEHVGPLTREHVIPESLGGMLELPEASCNACQSVTSAVEGYNAARLFRPLRRQFNLPSKSRGRARREAREKEQFAIVVNGIRRYVPAEEYPGLIVSFVFPMPTIFLGVPPDIQHDFAGGGVTVSTLPEFGDRLNALRAKYGNDVKFVTAAGAETVARLLAKIGHAYAAAEIGYRRFRPYLLGIIRNQDPRLMHHLIGTAMGDPPKGDDLHEINILPPGAFGDRKLIVVKIQLFANLGLPVHYIVAGERL